MRRTHDVPVCMHAAGLCGKSELCELCIRSHTRAKSTSKCLCCFSLLLAHHFMASQWTEINRRPPGRARISAIGRRIKLVMATHRCFLLMMNLASAGGDFACTNMKKINTWLISPHSFSKQIRKSGKIQFLFTSLVLFLDIITWTFQKSFSSQGNIFGTFILTKNSINTKKRQVRWTFSQLSNQSAFFYLYERYAAFEFRAIQLIKIIK